MAHLEQIQFFERLRLCHPIYFDQSNRILEIGSQNINGSVRDFFKFSTEYIGIDLGIADDVDWVIPGEFIELPTAWSDVTISTECFEHCMNWADVLSNMIRITRPKGLVIITCAGAGRPTHGTLDSEIGSSPFTSDYYKNLGVNDFASAISLEKLFENHGFEVNSKSHDLYFWGIRSEVTINEIDGYWEDTLSRLARAQGQIGQAAARQAALKSELEKAKCEAEHAKNEAEQSKKEAEHAKNEAEQSKKEAEQFLTKINKIRSTKTFKLINKLQKIKNVFRRK